MMKKLLSVIIFAVVFSITYVALCYLMPIKLSAEPLEYLIASLQELVWLKCLISLVAGMAMSILPSMIKGKE